MPTQLHGPWGVNANLFLSLFFCSNDVKDDALFFMHISVFTFEIGYGDPLGRKTWYHA